MPPLCHLRLSGVFTIALFFSTISAPAHEGALCVDGSADVFTCLEIDLQHRLDLGELGGSASSEGSDIWGWTDAASGREFALVGLTDLTAFVEVSDPQEPVVLGTLPSHSTEVNFWRDIKTFGDHAFIVADHVSDHGMQVFDLSQLLEVGSPPVVFSETAHYSGFSRAHNIVINESSGFAYAVGTETCSGGLHMIDINTPTSPSFVGCYGGDGYTHDAQCVNYAGPDPDHAGQEICLNSNEDTLTIVDVSDKATPTLVSRSAYAGSGYTHQGWLTEDHAYFLLDDETDESAFGHTTKTYIWDLRDLDSPTVIGTYLGPVAASDHNLYIRDGFAFLANYRSGLRILDIKDIANAQLAEVAFFDTQPASDSAGFSGAWSSYPYFDSKTVVVSDTVLGLFVLRPTGLCTDPAAVAGLSAAPAGDQQIDLSWTDDAAPGESYSVWRAIGTCPASDMQLIAEGLSGAGYSDSGVAGGVEYAYEVRKVDPSGSCQSASSSCSAATTTGACNAPPLFAGLQSVIDPSDSSCRLDLSWTAAQPNCGSDASYSVYRSLSTGFTPDPTSLVAESLSLTTWSDSSLLGGTTYHYIVRASDEDNGIFDSNLIERSQTPTGPSTDGAWTTGAEVGNPGLRIDTGVNPLLAKHAGWHISEARAHSGVRSFFSEANDSLCSSVSTPALTLSVGQASELSFWTVYDIEDDSSGLAWDGGVVEISLAGGDWTRLDLDPGYPTTWRSSTDACGYPTGSPAFSGRDLSWTRYSADLSSWAGQSIEVRWIFSTDGAVTEEGWYLDDIALTHVQVPGECVGSHLLFADGFESGDDSAWK